MVEDTTTVTATIARELKVNLSQVDIAIRLLDEGATVPFIARYRKEVTAGLSDTHLRVIAERLHYIRELDERRLVILQSISEQEKLTPALRERILAATTKTHLEDLYLPYRPKRRTKALVAREAGLEPLAQLLLDKPTISPEEHAVVFINPDKGITCSKTALEGARQILMERFAEDAELVNELRDYLWQNSVLKSTVFANKKTQASKYVDYFDYAQAIHKIPSHRALALFRGRRESVLQLSLIPTDPNYGLQRLANYFNIVDRSQAVDSWLQETLSITWKSKLLTKLELELLARLREAADEEAIYIFARNLKDLLLAAPAGPRVTIGLDPGIRTGIKVVVIDTVGNVLDYTTLLPFAPQNDWHQSIAQLAKLAAKYNADLISIGNGTGSRETERLVADMIKMYPDLTVTKVLVNEAGASVYSASELAENEFPDLDVSIRGAVSIARRLQDPLAELVKIEPKSIGVGQYQHDVNQQRLGRSLTGVVEDCVNAVGVNINTASVALLKKISGFNDVLAKNVVQYREEHGLFDNREQLKNIPRMGEKSFQQAAGFLRINNGSNPLDMSAVHPEAYPLVEKILTEKAIPLSKLIGNHAILGTINAQSFVCEQFGLPTICDVLRELEKPGRDPRPQFRTVSFKEGIEDISHLQEGMILDGVVSNVTKFGAFVDVGVHQDGLVHISAMTNRFISDPHLIVKAGDIVTVRVIEIDQTRKRIGLSMKIIEDRAPTVQKNTQSSVTPLNNFTAKAVATKPATIHKKYNQHKKTIIPKKGIFNTAMADALAKLKEEL